MANKMTYVDALNIALTADLPEEVKEKLTALRDQTAKRNSTENRKPTKAQVANEGLKAVVLNALTADPCTVSELMMSALSNQKVSALVNALVREGAAVKVPDKRVNRFAKA